MTLQVVKLGAARCDGTTNVPMARVQLDLGDGEVSDYGEVPMMQALGLAALPAPASSSGEAAEGVLDEEVAGLNGCVVGGRDVRCADVVGTMSPGDTTLHGTHTTSSKRAQFCCKENLAAILVGNDLVITMDRANKRIQIAGFGHLFEMSDADGINLAAAGGQAGIKLKGGTVAVWGSSVTLGGATMPPVAGVTSVLYGPAGIAGVPATGVHIIPA